MGNNQVVKMDLFNIFDDLISFVDNDGRIIDCNDSYANFFKKNKDELKKQNEKDLFPLIDSSKKNSAVEKVDINSSLYFFEIKKHKKFNNEDLDFSIIIRKDISEDKKLSSLFNDDKKILKHIANGDELNLILDKVIESAEKMNNDMKCSILLLDETKEKLFSASAPSIPSFFSEKVSGMQIGEKVGSCGAAAFKKERIIVEDIQTHENWQLAKRLAQKANLYACWSQPIFSSKGEVLGTFAMYYSTPKKPTDFDLYVIEDRASFAGIAIEKHYNELQIQKNLENEKKQEEILMHKSKQAMMGEMLENIAHQWRQPLSVISTSATGLNLKKELGILDDKLEIEALKGINDNAQYLSKTIDDFRNYFKSKNVEKEFILNDTIKKSLKLMDVSFKTKQVNVHSQLEEIPLYTLENELIQVLMNILNNSVDEFERRSIDEKSIFINSFRKDDEAIIKIIDSAGGAKEDIVNRVFEPYFTTKHQSKGTGIGLHMCKEMLEKHMDGTIEAKNSTYEFEGKNYKGLEFTIKLPIKIIEVTYEI